MITNNVKTIRQSKGWSQAKLAALSEIQQSDISQVENGKKPAFPDWRKRIAAAFDEPEEKIFPNVS